MRIAQVYPSYWPYVRRGVERYCHDLSTFLAARGHEVDIITSKPGATRERCEDGVRIVYLAQANHPILTKLHPLFRFYSFNLTCLPWLLRERYDVAHVWTYPYAPAMWLVGAMRGTPYLYHTVVTLPHQRGAYYLPPGLDRWVFQRAIEGAARVAVLNHEAARELERGWGITPVVLPAPVDVEVFRPLVEPDLQHPRVLFTADLSDPRKGGVLLLRAWNFVHRACPEAVLVLAGPFGHAVGQVGIDLPAIIPNLVEEPARRQIEILGPGTLEGLPLLYSEAAVTVLPSIDEPFGMVLTESLACGTPVVCGDQGGPGEIVAGANVGATIPLTTFQDLYSMTRARQLADAILRTIDLASQPGTAERCRAHVQQWRLEAVAQQVEDTYCDIVGSHT